MILGGNSGTEFTIDSASGVIFTAKTLDYETATSYTLTVTASDGGSPALSSTSDITVTITDVNDNTPVCSPAVYSPDVLESSATGATVSIEASGLSGCEILTRIESGIFQ